MSLDGNSAIKSIGNSSSTALGIGQTFTGVAEYNNYHDALVTIKTDTNCTMYAEFSLDGTNWDSSIAYEIHANTSMIHRLVKGSRYFRLRVYNDSGVGQTYLRVQTMYGMFGPLTSSFTSTVHKDSDAIAVRAVTEEEILSRKIEYKYIINKYGRNNDVDSAEDIWDGGGTYTGFPTTTAEEFQVLSSSVNDTSAGTGARIVRLYYLDSNYEMFDSSNEYLYVDVTLNGVTPVNSGITGMRVWRVKVISSGSTQSNEGLITVRWRTTTSVVFSIMQIGSGQSEVAGFTVPNGYTAYLKHMYVSMGDNTSNQASMAIKTCEYGSNTCRKVRPFVVSTSQNSEVSFYGGTTFESKESFIFTCTSISNANGIISVIFDLLLIKNL